jgi:hypothetical protein
MSFLVVTFAFQKTATLEERVVSLAAPQCLETFNPSDGYWWRKSSMTHVQALLMEFGQTLLPIDTAPRDGRIVLCYSQRYGLVPVHWVTDPFPEWRTGSELGFIDHAFVGWYDHTKFRPVGESELTRLLVAYIDDMREEKRHDVLKLLETPTTPKVSNDNPLGAKGTV